MKLQIGELLEYRKLGGPDLSKGAKPGATLPEGFAITDQDLVEHYFYFVDGRFVKYDGWSSRPEDAQEKWEDIT